MNSYLIAWVFIFMGILVFGHLGLIYVDLWTCWNAFTMMADGFISEEFMNAQDCDQIEETYQEAVNHYLAVATALVGGGAMGATLTKKDNEE